MSALSHSTMDTSSMLATIVVAVPMLYAFCRAMRNHLETKKPFEDIPLATGTSHWFWGNAREFLAEDFVEGIKRLTVYSANEYGQTGFWILFHKWVAVRSVKDARTILSVEHERRPVRLARHYVGHFVGVRNLLFLNGKEWKFHRAAVVRTFNPDFLNSSKAIMRDISEVLVTSIQNKIKMSPEAGESLDVLPIMNMATLEIFGKLALSTDFGLCETLKPSSLVNAFKYTLNGTMERLRAPFRLRNLLYWIPTKNNIMHNKERHMIRSFVADLINAKRNSVKGQDNNDLLSHLIRAHQNMDHSQLNPEDVSDEAMIDVMMTLLFAGYDTTSVTLSFALYLLAINTDVQESLVKEIKAVKNLENSEELVYCFAVIWETLRLYPAAVFTNRKLAKDVPLSGGFVAPAGCNVQIPIYTIHRDEKNFPKPDEFRPDRWARFDDDKGVWVERDTNVDNTAGDDNMIPAGDRKAMLAFSSGGRNCVGQRFAQIEATIVLASLIKGLKFSALPDFELKTSARDLIHKPANGMLPLNVEVRADEE